MVISNEMVCDPTDNGGATNASSDDNVKLLEKQIKLLELKLELEKEKNKTVVTTYNAKPEVPFETLKELVADYDGVDDFKTWWSQLLHFQQMLKVSDEALGIIVRLKLKGEALSWYNANMMFTRDVGVVLVELAAIFAKRIIY